MSADDLLTVQDTAVLLGVHRVTVYKWLEKHVKCINGSELPVIKVGHTYRISRSKLLALMGGN